jgi:hypothetical protein
MLNNATAAAEIELTRSELLREMNQLGFASRYIARVFPDHSRPLSNLGKAIGELSRKKVLLFGLIRECRFTADELAEKLSGSGEKVGKVFDADPDIRAALKASYRQWMLENPAIKRIRFA